MGQASDDSRMFSLLIFVSVLLIGNFKHCKAGHIENQKGWLILLISILLNLTTILIIIINSQLCCI